MSGGDTRGISGDDLRNHVGIRIHSDVDGHQHGGTRNPARLRTWSRILYATDTDPTVAWISANSA
jgi:hypothetical protein